VFDSLDDSGTNEAHERRIKRCSSCNAQIIWFKSAAGNWCPIDADTVEPEDSDLDTSRHVSHFSTCANADKHRKSRGKK
jgi:hypothetical protein